MSETVIMGNLAIRSHFYRTEKKNPVWIDKWDYPGQKKLLWDGKNLKITNFDEANAFVKRDYREGWIL